ncbi:MAG: DUF3500 domain-containing protein [Chloroflexi bacterium]|nr:DUF3500 domain-containing protein [Chloroflexota bacterium]
MTLQLSHFKPRNRTISSGRALPDELPERFKTMLENAERLLSDDFRGVTEAGSPESGLYSIKDLGASNAGVTRAAKSFLASLSADERESTLFSVDSDAWRRWSNVHPYLMRHGAFMDELAQTQRDLGMELLRESLSPRGFKTAQDIMRLNESILEITGRDDEYGEWLYWLSIMGEPSDTQPWGWQIDGHHLIINYFVLGGQVVATPTFMGSEPVAVDSGKYAGTRVFQAEEENGLALGMSFTPDQRAKATIAEELPGDVFTSAFRDNFEMRYEGIGYDELSSGQQNLVMAIAETYLGRMPEAHAKAKMAEVRAHLDKTYIAWIGGFSKDSVFYYRVHSPVVLIEFDHQRGIALDDDEPTRNHIHTVVRTPNGNDYGKDLLRLHREQHHRNGV